MFTKCVIYRLCLNVKIFKEFFLKGALMITGYSTMSSVVLWLILGYISHNTTTELTVEYPVIINAPLRKNFKIFLMFRHNL